MKKSHLIIFGMLCISFAEITAQNLVSNPSFEQAFEQVQNCLSKKEVDKIMLNIPSLQLAKVKDWASISESSTADIYQTCFDSTSGNPEQFGATRAKFGVPRNMNGWQMPRSGKNYAGVYVLTNLFNQHTYREYLSGKLIKPLKKGETYTITFWCNLSDDSKLAGRSIGLYLSSKPVKYPSDFAGVVEAIPQIKNPTDRFLTNKKHWVKVTANYTARGGEKHLLIGNFQPDNPLDYKLLYKSSLFALPILASSYYFIDDVCVNKRENDCYTSVQDTLDIPENEEVMDYNPAKMELRGFVFTYGNFMEKNPIETSMRFQQNGQIVDKKIPIRRVNSKRHWIRPKRHLNL